MTWSDVFAVPMPRANRGLSGRKLGRGRCGIIFGFVLLRWSHPHDSLGGVGMLGDARAAHGMCGLRRAGEVRRGGRLICQGMLREAGGWGSEPCGVITRWETGGLWLHTSYGGGDASFVVRWVCLASCALTIPRRYCAKPPDSGGGRDSWVLPRARRRAGCRHAHPAMRAWHLRAGEERMR